MLYFYVLICFKTELYATCDNFSAEQPQEQVIRPDFRTESLPCISTRLEYKCLFKFNQRRQNFRVLYPDFAF